MLEIELPVDFIVDLSAQATSIVADLFPIWALVGGIGLGLTVVLFIVNILGVAKNGREAVQQSGPDADMDDELMP